MYAGNLYVYSRLFMLILRVSNIPTPLLSEYPSPLCEVVRKILLMLTMALFIQDETADTLFPLKYVSVFSSWGQCRPFVGDDGCAYARKY